MPLEWSAYYSPKFIEAFFIEVNIDPKLIQAWGGGPICLRIPYNCYGEPIPVKGSERYSRTAALQTPGYEWAYPDFVCTTMNYKTKFNGMLQDIRTVSMMMEGCCPETLNAELLGGEEGQD